MFARIRSTFNHRPRQHEEWNALYDAGYSDVPRYVRRDARESAERDLLRFQTLGHLR